MNPKDELYIRRCFELAKKGAGNTSPNPMVGAVIVHNDRIIGEGYHMHCGQAHAEVNAVNSVQDRNLLKDSTIYVSLEPCSHYGKTPPCAKLLVECGFRRCVVANFDPNPKVAGKGLQMLKDAGIEVECGVLEREGRWINRRFFCNQEKHRPYVILKYAVSKDGFMAPDYSPYWITNDACKVFVHKMRAEEDAVFVGANTVIKDNPRLNVREFYGRNPIRIVYDRPLTLGKDYHIFDNTQKTVVFNEVTDRIEGNTEYIRVRVDDHRQMLEVMYRKGICSVIVEGGKKTLESFLDKGLWDEAYVLEGSQTFGSGIKHPAIAAEYLRSTSAADDNRINLYVNNGAY